jgi:hypothetical protein
LNTLADTDAAALRTAMLVWTASALAEAAVFALSVVPRWAANPLHPGLATSLLVVAQPIVSVGFPVALWMVARRRGIARGPRNSAWACLAVSVAAWLTYDVAGLHRLLPFTRPLIIAGISLPSLVPYGWWLRNLELVTTTILVLRIVRARNDADDGGRRWMTGLVGCLILAVTLKALALLAFQYAVSHGIGIRDTRHRFVLFATTSVALQILQRVAAVALGALSVRQSTRSLGPTGHGEMA